MGEYEISGYETSATEQWEPDELMNPRPKWPKVIGAMSIIIASFGLVCGGTGLAVAPLAGTMMEGMLDGDPLPDGLKMHALDYVIGGTRLIFAALLLIAGIACVIHRPIARILHLFYALCMIPLNIGNYLNGIAKMESLRVWAQQYPNNDYAKTLDPANNPMADIQQVMMLVLLILFGIGIPVFYLIWFGLIKTKPEQFTGDEEGIY